MLSGAKLQKMYSQQSVRKVESLDVQKLLDSFIF